MAAVAALLKIEPLELKFPFELNKQISCSLHLENLTDDHIAFKVLVNKLRKYTIQPNAGIMPPRTKCDISVTMQALSEAPPDMKCEDKFLLKSFAMSAVEDSTIDTLIEKSGKKVHTVKLPVSFALPTFEMRLEDDLSAISLIRFKQNELEEITENYKNIVGSGGSSSVYSGRTPENQEVAVKVFQVCSNMEMVFKNELKTLSAVEHRSVVKLLGYCLDNDSPKLVYEFVPKGNLYDFLHGEEKSPLPFFKRVAIAAASADGFAYIHSSLDKHGLHGDIKSANIALDNNLKPKIVDFGISKLLPTRDTTETFTIRGTFGYIDPEYLENGLLSQKSDVYSFGVVLLELLTRKKPTGGSALVADFRLAYKAKTARTMFDTDIVNEMEIEFLEEFAQIAFECVRKNSNKRPNMSTLSDSLSDLRTRLEQMLWD